MFDTAANFVQLYGSDLKGLVLGLLIAALWSLGKELVPDSSITQAWIVPAWWWVRASSIPVLILLFLALWWQGHNLVENGSFTRGVRYWGNGYYEDLLLNGNWDTPETNRNYVQAMASFPYVLHMPRPARPADADPVPNSTGRIEHVPGSWWPFSLDRRAFRINFSTERGHNRYGTLSQRISVEPHRNYRVRFRVRAEEYSPGALFLTTERNWRECAVTEIPVLGQWRTQECYFATADRDYVDLRFVVRGPARVWITDVEARAD